jgi:hypothetical protein
MRTVTRGAGWLRGLVIAVKAIVATGAGAEEYLTDFVPGYQGVITKVSSIVLVAGTGVGATRLFRLLKGTSTVVASKTIALADVAAQGTVIDWALSTTPENLAFGDTDTLSLDVTAAGTEFTALTMNVLVQARQRPQQA